MKKYLALLLILTGCSLTIEKTTVDGSDNKIAEENKTDEKTNFKAKATIPLLK